MQPRANMKPVWLRTNALAIACVGVILGACAGSEPPAIATNNAGLGCVDDSPECIARRKATLQTLVNDPSRKWVKEPVSPKAYASGVRLFAFKNKKKDLSCEELTHGRKEADGASASLRSNGSGLTPAQVSRGAILAQDVGRELGNEYNRRCKKG